MKKEKYLKEIIKPISEIVRSIKKEDRVAIIHHSDADGNTSAALFSILIHNLIDDCPLLLPVAGVNYITRTLINKLKTLNPDHVFVLDLPVDPRKFNIFKGFILDHHAIFNLENEGGMAYFNPHKFEKVSDEIAPTSYISYKILKEFFPNEKVSWIAGIGITEDHRVELCREVFETIKEEYPNLLKIEDITQKNIENTIFGELWDTIRSGRMIKGNIGAETAVLALVECKEKPGDFINGLTQNSYAIKRIYEKMARETQDLLRDTESRGTFHKNKKVIFYKSKRSGIRSMTSFLSDKIRQKYPDWIVCVYLRDESRNVKMSIRLEQTRRDEDLVSIIEGLKDIFPGLRGGGHKSAVGLMINKDDIDELKKEFLELIEP